MHRPQKRTVSYGTKKQNTNAPIYRTRSADEYHTSKWTKASRRFKENKVCVICEREGITTEAEVTDHIIPPEVFGDFWDESNWQPLCKKHNIEKGLTIDKQLIQQHRRNEQRKTRS